MPRRPRTTRASTQTSLGLGSAAERLVALQRERDRLLKQIGNKKDKVEQVEESAREASSLLFEKLPALVERRRGIIREIRGIFSELLARGRLARTAQRAVLDVLESLRSSGMIDDPYVDAEFEPGAGADFEPPFEEWAPFDHPHEPSQGAHRPTDGPNERASASAAHVGGRADKASVREVFRRLAIALHPDRTQHEPERQRRTEVMKEVTRAYEEGDLARLLQIEATWLAGSVLPSEGPDAERRLAALERVVADLKRQLKELTRKLRELKRTSPLEGLEGFVSGAPGASPIEALLQQAEQELDTLSGVREFARRFRDREISLAEFLAGPDVLRDQAYGDAEFEADLDLFERIFREEMDFDARRAAPKKTSRARKR